MFFFGEKNKKELFKEKDLFKNTKLINKIKKLSNLEIIEFIEESIEKKEWIKINFIMQKLNNEQKKIISEEIKKNQVLNSKIYMLLFQKEKINENTLNSELINKEINKNTDW